MRLFRRVGGAVDTRTQMVGLVRDTLHGFDDAHMQYLIEHNVPLWDLIPQPLVGHAMTWMLPQARIMSSMTAEEILAACCEARPSCTALFSTPEGQRWLRLNLGDVPFFLKLLV